MYTRVTKEEISLKVLDVLKNRLRFDEECYADEMMLAVDVILDNPKEIYMLSDVQLLVLKERLGLNQEMTPRTLEEISVMINCSVSSVRGIENRVFRVLTGRIRQAKQVLCIKNMGFSPEIEKFVFNNARYQTIGDYLNVNITDEIYCAEIRKIALERFSDGNLESDFGQTPISALKLSNSTENRLRRAGIHTVESLLKMTEDEINALRNVGERTFREITDSISKQGYTFFDDKARRNSKENGKSLPLSKLKLCLKTYNALLRAGIDTIEALTKMTSEEIDKIPNIGIVAHAEIVEKVDSLGYEFVDKSKDNQTETFDFEKEVVNRNNLLSGYVNEKKVLILKKRF